jgi:ABC-type Fe3+ transport system substrate-binding protein
MNRPICGSISLILLVIGFVWCVPMATPEEKSGSLAWKNDWENILASAKNEKQLLIFCGGGGAQELVTAFMNKFGIKVEVLVGRTGELTQKLLQERRAGIKTIDLYISGEVPDASVFATGAFTPIKPLLILPEVIDKGAYFDDTIPFADKEEQYTIVIGPYVSMNLAINSDAIKAEEINGYGDLLDSKWKGKISINDPTKQGQGLRWFDMTSRVLMNLDFHRKLVRQEPVLTTDKRLQVEWLARGKYPIAVASSVPSYASFKKAGAPINWVLPKEGLYLASVGSGMVSFMRDAPHPNASKLFVNWLLSKEGLTIWSKENLCQSARKDVPTDFLDQDTLRNPAVKYHIAYREDVVLRQDEDLRLVQEIYGPLLK